VDVLAALRANTGIAGVAIALLFALVALVVVRGQPRDARWPFLLIAIHLIAELS